MRYLGTAAEALCEFSNDLAYEQGYRVSGIPGVYAEIVNASFKIDGGKSIVTSSKRKFNYRSMLAEAVWNLQDTNDITFLKRYIPNMSQFCDGTDRAAWAYGPWVAGDMQRAAFNLLAHRDSRQATVATANPYWSSAENSPPCLIFVQWLVRNRKLHQIVNMRSNDVYLGLPLDIFQFSFWHVMMGAFLGYELGSYIHNAGSLHLYERDVDAVKLFLTDDRFNSVDMPPVGKNALFQILDKHPLTAYPSPESADRFSDVLHYMQLLWGDYSYPTWQHLQKYGRGWAL